MSIWIYMLMYVMAMSTVSQTPQRQRKRRARLKMPPSLLQKIETKLGYTENLGNFNNRNLEEPKNEGKSALTLPEPKIFLELLNNMSVKEYHENAVAQWNFESNITEFTRLQALNSSRKFANFQRSVWDAVMRYDWRNFDDSSDVKRQFEMMSVLGVAALPDDKFTQLDEIINHMESIYSTAIVTAYDKPPNASIANEKTANETGEEKNIRNGKTFANVTSLINKTESSKPMRSRNNAKRDTRKKLRLEPDLLKIVAESTDPDELSYIWKAWRDATGGKMRKEYVTYVELMKEVAKLNNYSSAGKYWTNAYDDPDFEETISSLWKEIRPLYLELHAYVRNRLRKKYGPDRVPVEGYLPVHLLGDMWAQSWINVQKFTMPYPESARLDLTNALIEKNFTTREFFKLAEDFFHSLGFENLPETFWKRSILERPADKRELVCHGSAWDMYDGDDFRIKMCTQVTYEDLLIVHHEMGHVQYFMQYKDQPIIYREGANPGFHEAVGDTMALSVSSPPHTYGLGLTENSTYDDKKDINFLFMMALQKVAFIPFAYCLDKWRWMIFGGDVPPENYNDLWWKLRAEIQGVEPPVQRGGNDFDPGAKYHVAANVPYIRYFISFIIQFQFYEAVCLNSGQYDPDDVRRPLHRCDIYGSKAAGLAMRQMMKLGSSKPWADAMEILTGRRNMQTRGLLSYFRPLHHWLKNENKRTHEPVGF